MAASRARKLLGPAKRGPGGERTEGKSAPDLRPVGEDASGGCLGVWAPSFLLGELLFFLPFCFVWSQPVD